MAYPVVAPWRVPPKLFSVYKVAMRNHRSLFQQTKEAYSFNNVSDCEREPKEAPTFRLREPSPFCILFTETTNLNDYTLACRERSEAFSDGNDPQIIIFIRKPGVELFMPKQELMKIGTRIFNTTQPNRVYIFLEIEGKNENAEVLHAVQDFLTKINEIPEDTDPPEWISDYIYQVPTEIIIKERIHEDNR